MKILDISPISDTSQMPIIKGTLQFLQDAHKETIANTVIGMIGSGYDTSTAYILWGCVNSGSGNNFNISAGAVFFNGEVFAVDAAVFTKTSGQAAISNIVTSQYTTNADPVTFSDGTVANVHNIRKIIITAGTSGSGSAPDYIYFNRPPFQNVPVSIAGSGGITVTGTYPNISIYTPVSQPTNLSLLWVGNINSGGTTATKLGGTATVTSVSRNSTGDYTINHNVGNTSYFIDGVGLDQAGISVRAMYLQTANQFRYTVSDDSSLNDANHQVRIFGYQ
jgi:hypothetical protein